MYQTDKLMDYAESLETLLYIIGIAIADHYIDVPIVWIMDTFLSIS